MVAHGRAAADDDGALIREPHGVVARVMTWVPFTSAAVVILRASMDAAALAWWEAAGAFVVLAYPPGWLSGSARDYSASACSARAPVRASRR